MQNTFGSYVLRRCIVPWIISVVLLPVLAVSGDLGAREIEVPADLEAPLNLGQKTEAWKFKQGDQSDYRLRDFDDSDWKYLKGLPHNWLADGKEGQARFGWYRIALRFPSGSDGREIMFRVGPISDSDEFYFNGVRVGATGGLEPGAYQPSRPAYDRLRFYSVPPNLIRFGEKNVIAIRVQASFSNYAGFTASDDTIILGRVAQLRNQFYEENLPSLLMCMVLLTVGGYFLLLFARRRHTWENFWFALTCFAFGLYYILQNQLKYTVFDDMLMLKRMEYGLVFIQVQIFMNFNYAYFPRSGGKGDGVRRVMVLVSNVVGLISVFVPLVSSDIDFWHWWNVTISQPFWLLPVIVVFWTQIREAWNGSSDARWMLGAGAFGLAALINDILVQRETLSGIVLGHYGFFIFILALASILANRFVRLHNEVQELNVGLERRVARRTSELSQALDSLQEARDETDKIMKTVDEGLLLVYPVGDQYKLGREYSAAVDYIFEELHETITTDKDLERYVFYDGVGGASPEAMPETLREMLEAALGADSWEAFAEYGRLLFNPGMDDGLVEQVNPLRRVKFDLHDSATGWARRKYLRFQFRRIRRGKDIAHVMVQIRDVTAEVELEQRLAEKEQEERGRMRRLTELLQVEPAMLAEFMDDVRAELVVMDEAQETFSGPDDRKERLNAVFRSLHTIKGNAALLEMETFAERAHAHEEEIARLGTLEKPEPDEEEILRRGPREITAMMDEIAELFKRLRDFQERFETAGNSGKESLLVRALRETVKTVGRDSEKKIILRVEGLESANIADSRKKMVKDLLIQLVRNSAAHGIERPDVRAKLGKPEDGTIRIQIARDEPHRLRIDVSDDGGGLDLEALRARARAAGSVTAEAAASMTDREAAQLIFVPGISTAEELTLAAGRGVGMDVVKSALDKVGGEIQVYSERGKNCTFKILLPE